MGAEDAEEGMSEVKLWFGGDVYITVPLEIERSYWQLVNEITRNFGIHHNEVPDLFAEGWRWIERED